MDNTNQSGTNQSAPNQATTVQPVVMTEERHSGSALAIWLLVLGIIVGAVAMWAFDSFYRIPNRVSQQVAEEVARVKIEIAEENNAEQFSVTGTVAAIEEDEMLLVVNVGYDTITSEDGEPQQVAREISFKYDANTIFKVRNDEIGELEESSLAALPGGKSVVIKSDQAITNYLIKYYAKEVTSF